MATLKKIILVLALSVTAWAQTGLPSHVNRLTFLREVRAVRDSIVAAQEKYHTKHGRYFQGLASDTLVRDLSLDLKRFNRVRRPTDQAADWVDFGLRDISVRGTYRVDVYQGPGGWGYVMTVSIKANDQIYSLSRNVGPEIWRDTNLIFIKQ